MSDENYVIECAKFDQMQKNAEEINGNLTLINMFCKQYEDTEEFYIALNLLKYTKKIASSLDYEFFKIQYSEEEE